MQRILSVIRLLVLVAIVLALVLISPADLAAQTRYSVVPFAAQNRALPDAPALYGVSLGAQPSVVGFRIGGALGAFRTVQRSENTPLSRPMAWTADVDAVLSPARLPYVGALFGGFEPIVFAGVGVQGARDSALTPHSSPVRSYGAGVSQTLAGGIGIFTEARRRIPESVSGSTLPIGFHGDWEYRAGLSFSFGRRGRSSGIASKLPFPIPLPTGRGSSSGTRPVVSAASVLNTADDYLGTRYTYGGTSPSGGFDCSGFVQYVFRKHRVELPRTSRQQASAGDGLVPSLGVLRPGDLLMFAGSGTRIDHVAIYAGDHRIIHSSSSGNGVRYDDLDTKRGQWFVDHMVAARRVIADGHSLVDALAAGLRVKESLDPPDAAPKP